MCLDVFSCTSLPVYSLHRTYNSYLCLLERMHLKFGHRSRYAISSDRLSSGVICTSTYWTEPVWNSNLTPHRFSVWLSYFRWGTFRIHMVFNTVRVVTVQWKLSKLRAVLTVKCGCNGGNDKKDKPNGSTPLSLFVANRSIAAVTKESPMLLSTSLSVGCLFRSTLFFGRPSLPVSNSEQVSTVRTSAKSWAATLAQQSLRC